MGISSPAYACNAGLRRMLRRSQQESCHVCTNNATSQDEARNADLQVLVDDATQQKPAG